MIPLAAVRPDWLSVLDGKPSSREWSIYVLGGDWYAAGFVSQETFRITKGRTDNPESKPSAMRWQGLSKVDWVTVWFFCLKEKSTVSPGCAFYENM